MLRGSESVFCGDSYIHNQGTAQRIRKNSVQKGMERLPSCQRIGETMAQYMNSNAIDFDTLNKAIDDLSKVIEPIANFFNGFRR